MASKPGTIDGQMIYDTHSKMKELMESYKDVNLAVNQATNKVLDNWVGKGRNEFESQYNLLIKKIDDFGDLLKDIYEALVDAESAFLEMDDNIRQDFVMSSK